jgi:two-component system, NtrC family, response regulator HydG
MDEKLEHELSTFAHASNEVAQNEEPRRVLVIEGPDAGKAFDLDPYSPTRILVGTSPVCQIRLSDPSVSRRHLALEPQGRRYRITDLGSTNGTFIDGIAVIDGFIRGDEIVRVGATAMRIEAAEGGAAAASPLPSAIRFGRVIGASVAMRRIYPLCEKLAKVDVPVLIEGETGTGKELVAEAIYEAGGSTGPFVVFDCTTVSPQLMEAELFGHEKGSFTGATSTRKGIFEEANGGTLLIDEIGDLELPLQAKLLRVLDRQEVRRVGSNHPIKVEVRVLAATRRDLDKAIAAGQFRDDLYHRLAVARVEVPALRQRHGDVSLLSRAFAREFGVKELPQSLLAKFEEYAWPGNVRELRNAIARYAALGEPMLGELASGPSSQRGARAPGGQSGDAEWLEAFFQLPFAIARRKAQDEFSRRYVERVLEQHNGSVTQAARASGVALRYFRLVKARTRR